MYGVLRLIDHVLYLIKCHAFYDILNVVALSRMLVAAWLTLLTLGLCGCQPDYPMQGHDNVLHDPVSSDVKPTLCFSF